jgi:hypothetical protein
VRSEGEVEQVRETDIRGYQHSAPGDGSIQHVAIGPTAEVNIQNMFGGESCILQRPHEGAREVLVDEEADHLSG